MKHEYNFYATGGFELEPENFFTTSWSNCLTLHSLKDVYEMIEKYPNWTHVNKCQLRHNKWVIVATMYNHENYDEYYSNNKYKFDVDFE